jgi:hypothetical protein
MAIGTDIYRVLYTFDLGTDGEVAETGFHVRWAQADPVSEDNLASLLGHVAAAWSAGFASVAGDFPTTVVLSKVGVYHVTGAPGGSDGFATEAVSGDDAWAGTAGTSLPWECTLCITTETTHGQVAKPRRQRGRMFLPPMGSTVLDSGGFGLITTTKRDDLMNATLATLEAVNDEVVGAQVRAVVYSPTGAKTTDILFVSADNKVDAQRRRENRQLGWSRNSSADLDA